MKLLVAALLLAVLVEYGQAKRSIWWKKNAVSPKGNTGSGSSTAFENKVLECLGDIKEDVNELKDDMKKIMAKLGRLIQSGTALLEFNNHTYIIVKADSHWEGAKLECEAIGDAAHLLIIDSIEELEFIRAEIGVTPEIYWIGMSDAEVEGQWKWTDGTALAADIAAEWFTGHDDGSSIQPNGGAEQNCGQLRSDFSDNSGGLRSAGGAYLNDFYCDFQGLTAYRICEVDAPPGEVYDYYY